MLEQTKLFLAPMEGLGDRPFRAAMATTGGFDEACTEFLRVPKNAHCPSLAKRYQADELGLIPLAAQVMGFDLDLVPKMCIELEKRGAPRIDLNCGCPSNTVTGRGAGSSLLQNPDHLNQLVRAMVDSVSVPVSVKLRSGYQDTTLFDENIKAAEEAGACFLTLHPRTKVEGYKPPAHWNLITRAKELVDIPIIGNGDILTVADAARMLQETGCDGLMIGRGAARNPWIFQEIRGQDRCSFSVIDHYLRTYFAQMEGWRERTQVNKLKQMINYLFQTNEELSAARPTLLRSAPSHPHAFLEMILEALRQRGRFSIEKNALMPYK